MTQRRGRVKAVVGLRTGISGLAILGLFACAKVETFARPDAIDNGLFGKLWYSERYMELNPDHPALDGLQRAYQGFQLRASGNRAILAASFYDSVAGNFRGYGRSYLQGSGWSPTGSEFAIIANPSGLTDATYASIAAGPSGTWLASFKSGAAATEKLMTVGKNGSWQLADSYSASGGPVPQPSTIPDEQGLPLSSTFDAQGRAYVATFDTVTGGVTTTKLYRWLTGEGIAQVHSGQAYAASTGLETVDVVADGKDHVCVFSTGTVAGVVKLHRQCLDLSGSITWPGSATLMATVAVRGSATASDGMGNILAVWAESVSGVTQLRGMFIQDGTAGSAFTLSDDMASGWHLSEYSRAFSVTHLGSGHFMVGWVGDSDSADAIYYKTYNATTATWDETVALSQDLAYTSLPHLRALELFSNQDGNAGLAVLYDSDETETYQLVTGRYQIQQGWQTLETFGNGCYAPALEPTVGTSACTHRPQGAILSNGDTVVVWGDQDLSGRYRLMGVEFK